MKRCFSLRLLPLLLAISILLTACTRGEAVPPASPGNAATSGDAATPAPTAEKTPEFQGFTANDLSGNAVDDTVFQDYDLTMINIWATFCGPCKVEMPELGEIAAEYKDRGVQVIGIVVDVTGRNGAISASAVETAKEIVKTTGANYTHLLPSADLNRIKLNRVSSVPETIFVDSRGAIVGKSYVGSRSKQKWLDIIDPLLEDVRAAKPAPSAEVSGVASFVPDYPFAGFTSVTLSGEPITDDILAKGKISVAVLWNAAAEDASEMLQKAGALAEAAFEDAAVIGFVTGGDTEAAAAVVKSAGTGFPQVRATPEMEHVYGTDSALVVLLAPWGDPMREAFDASASAEDWSAYTLESAKKLADACCNG